MKRKYKIIIIIGLILIIASIIYIINPINVTYKLSGNFDSSGVSRRYEAVLKFKGNSLVSGYQTSFVGEGGGCVSECERTIKCEVVNGVWINSENDSVCDLNRIPNSRQELEQKIKINEIKPESTCSHNELCYTKYPFILSY